MSKVTLEKFYTAFQSLDAKTMSECYHQDVIFNDPVFENLNYQNASDMWAMLIKRSKGELDIDFHSVDGDNEKITCIWEAKYIFSQTGNAVHNVIHSSMEFRDGLIIKHTDEFDFWRWSKMALGLTGTLLGWSPLLRKRVRKVALISLSKYQSRK